MISHEFKPDPHGRDVCDQKFDEDGRVEFCGQRRSEHMDETHALKIQLATALRERDEARSRAADVQSANLGLARRMEEYSAEVQRLREAFMGLRETYGLVLDFAREVLGVLERGEDSHVLRVPDRTMKLLRCTDPIPTADDVVSDARAALATGGDRG